MHLMLCLQRGSQFSEDDTATPQDLRPRPQPRHIGIPLLTDP